MKKSLLILLIVLAMSSFLFATEYTIVDGSSNSYHIPVNGNSHYGWSRFIFTATEMSNAGITGSLTIYSIAFEIYNDVFLLLKTEYWLVLPVPIHFQANILNVVW